MPKKGGPVSPNNQQTFEGRSGVKSELLHVMQFRLEIDDLIGTGKGNVRSCWNKVAHTSGDKNPSLSFDPKTGGWKCHGCGEKGDIFGLMMKVKGVTFPDALKYYLNKYDLLRKFEAYSRFGKTARNSKKVNEHVLGDGTIRNNVIENSRRWTYGGIAQQKQEFMFVRYGLTLDTLHQYKVGFSVTDARVWIPIFVNNHLSKDGKVTTGLNSIVNVRKHDCFRSKASWMNMTPVSEGGKYEVSRKRPESVTLRSISMQDTGKWQPVWNRNSGKVFNIKGHGSPWLYPAQALLDNPAVYLVGGELKALLLNQLGVPAVSFTSGEGNYAKGWLPYFLGKSVKILMDADPDAKLNEVNSLLAYEREWCVKLGKKGLTNAERGTLTLGRVLSENGAIVQVGFWPDKVKKYLPAHGGDITDFLRLSGWNPDALEHLDWHEMERVLSIEEQIAAEQIQVGEAPPKWADMKVIQFSGLVDPANLNEWVRVKGIVAGRGEVPYIVPKRITVSCKFGRENPMPQCGKCNLPKMGFETSTSFPLRSQVELVGLPVDQVMGKVLGEMGIYKGCKLPDNDLTPASVEHVVLTPAVDHEDTTYNPETILKGEADAYQYAHRSVYLLSQDKIVLDENSSYEVGGKIIADPKKGTFTLAASEWRKTQNDIFSFRKNKSLNDQLMVAVRRAGETQAVDLIDAKNDFISDIRDHVVKQIYGQDPMIEAITLSWFLPFVFRLGQHVEERVCPSVMILGDTTVGKSTATGKIMRHFGAGRPYSAASDPTYAGLIGGNLQGAGGRMAFLWGVYPSANNGLVALDEYNKFPIDIIGKLTNVLSSGVAERTTVSGPKQTRAWVRTLCLCNPRGERRLGAYSDPLHAALQVATTVQDLGRFEYVFVQHQLPREKLSKLLRQHIEPEVEHLYTRELARYHLQWVWTRNVKTIKFRSPANVMKRAMDLADIYGSHTLMLPTQVRFKVGRIAAGFAAMLFSHDEDMNLIVEDEHVELALRFFNGLYSKYINKASTGAGADLMPEELILILNKVQNFKRLRFLALSDRWTREDLDDALGQRVATQFIEVAQWELGIITRQKRVYVAKHDSWSPMMESYINERERLKVYSEAG